MRILTKWTAVFLILSLLASCGGRNNQESKTGWTEKDKASAGFTTNKQYRGQMTPPGMVLIEGGTFTMGRVADDVMFDWNTTPNRQQVRSFYMDETEVSNVDYREYFRIINKYSSYPMQIFPVINISYFSLIHIK